ncbi:MAG: DUF2797 domain-containing protein [Gammaproteobacteria bacterium]|nr:DUF2797 domain-containing protein [Gammaproteobacteria bacterium]
MLSGNLIKMDVELRPATAVQYTMRIGTERQLLNPYIGSTIHLNFTGAIHCMSCGRKTNKSFQQGYCFPCMRSLAQCDTCIVRPETCHFEQGTCRDESWGRQHCYQPHLVYLANSSGLKVGITRHTQVPTRWIDQGAIQAIPLLTVANRLQSGLVEVILKKQVSDRTDWRKMLKNTSEPLDLVAERKKLLSLCDAEIDQLKTQIGSEAIQYNENFDITEIRYPVLSYPTKVTSLNFDKTPQISGLLQGIKGQYLIFDTGVLNIRKFGGYHIEFTA